MIYMSDDVLASEQFNGAHKELAAVKGLFIQFTRDEKKKKMVSA